MGCRNVLVLSVAASVLAGCAAQSKQAGNPIWVGTRINDLQQSVCNCGGVEDRKAFKKRRKAEARAQFNQQSGRN